MKRKVFVNIIIFAAFIVMIGHMKCFATNLEVTTGGDWILLTREGVTDQNGDYLPNAGANAVEIILLSGSTPNGTNRYGTPEGGDTIIGACLVGDGFPFGPDGCFDVNVSVLQNDKIICRIWNNPDINLATFYGDSPVYTVVTSTSEIWNINGDADVPAFSTTIVFDIIPPGPPSDLIATQEVSGDIILTWTPTTDADTAGTRLVWRTDRAPTMEWDYDDTNFTNVPTLSAQVYRHRNLTEGVTYEYAAFCYDFSSNFSTGVNTHEVSHDSLPPNVVRTDPISDETGVSSGRHIFIAFNDTMGTLETQSSFSISPSIPGGYVFNWPSPGTMEVIPASLIGGLLYSCSISQEAVDKAGNHLVSPYNWSFHTILGLPPTISLLKIDGWKRFPGDIISPQPRISAVLDDPEHSHPGVTTIEIDAISTTTIRYTFSTPEYSAIYNTFNGDLDVRFPTQLASGTYIIKLKVFDDAGNSTEESVAGLEIKGGGVQLQGPVINYPNPAPPGAGTTIAYTLNVPADIILEVRSGSTGALVFAKSISSGNPGGMAGYNEVYWNGRYSGEGDFAGSGLYLVKLRVGKEYLKPPKPSGTIIIGSFGK